MRLGFIRLRPLSFASHELRSAKTFLPQPIDRDLLKIKFDIMQIYSGSPGVTGDTGHDLCTERDTGFSSRAHALAPNSSDFGQSQQRSARENGTGEFRRPIPFGTITNVTTSRTTRLAGRGSVWHDLAKDPRRWRVIRNSCAGDLRARLRSHLVSSLCAPRIPHLTPRLVSRCVSITPTIS